MKPELKDKEKTNLEPTKDLKKASKGWRRYKRSKGDCHRTREPD